jgi:DNA-3-methyladenine glycosylase II
LQSFGRESRAPAGDRPLPPAADQQAGADPLTPDTNHALDHLAASDPVMRRLIEEHGPLSVKERRRGRPADPYGVLVRSIVGQQLSTKAANTIYRRLLDLFDGRVPTPPQLIEADPEAIRAAGLSRPKVAYLRDLAGRVDDGELELARLAELPDDEVSKQLTAVRGLGQWTADMFLMFQLGRPDVLPLGDLGIRRAIRQLYELPEVAGHKELTRLGELWRPYRTLACLYLWASLDNAPV